MNKTTAKPSNGAVPVEDRIAELLACMTLAEKVGQMIQLHASEGDPPDYLAAPIRAGAVGAVMNQTDVRVVNELQRLAVEESRLGIPLLVGRDVIHGFATVFPIPLGQAATWNPGLVREGARLAALEAAAAGVNWTFAPMIDVSRDPRWGRIAESFGEDVHLTCVFAVAMVEGLQGEDLAAFGSIAACAKHFAGYGAVESGRDYATTNIPQNELRNVYLPPFEAAVSAGVATLMTSFSEIDGIPGTANAFLLRQVLRDEWGFDGLVVSDWDSVCQLRIHGLTENDRESAFEAVSAGVDMEMAGDAYASHLSALVKAGRVGMDVIDAAVTHILRIKFRLGLFENPYAEASQRPPQSARAALEVAERMASQSVVLLKNDDGTLPLIPARLGSVAVIGPLADAPYEQLGTWIFDGDLELSVTPLDAIRTLLGDEVRVRYSRAMANSRSRETEAFGEAVEVARSCDAAILFLGEESILSGEAHSRADIDLPGDQEKLVRQVKATGKPVIAVILAGRPLTLANVIDHIDALLFAWHPGAMTGPALAKLLFGCESPSGKLPVSFPRMVGQVPIYHSQKNSGKPPLPETVVHIDEIDTFAPQTSIGMTAFHLDAGYKPLFAFGHGLSYTQFSYDRLRLSAHTISLGETLTISAELSNVGETAAEEVAQLYVRDLVGSVTRPVRQLAGFRRVRVEPGETVTVSFRLHTDDLGFYGRDQVRITEAGEFNVWIGGSSETELGANFRIIANG
jgi:beta-glucosidase